MMPWLLPPVTLTDEVGEMIQYINGLLALKARYMAVVEVWGLVGNLRFLSALMKLCLWLASSVNYLAI
jgi:hypothetical protein